MKQGFLLILFTLLIQNSLTRYSKANKSYKANDGSSLLKELRDLVSTGKPGSYNDLGCCYSICTSAFENCTSLTQIVIPYGFTFIGDKAFAGCTNLKNVYLPNTVQFIGRDAFQNTPFNVVFMESQKQYRKNANLCQYCGGTFKGLLTKTCSRCGKIKDY